MIYSCVISIEGIEVGTFFITSQVGGGFDLQVLQGSKSTLFTFPNFKKQARFSGNCHDPCKCTKVVMTTLNALFHHSVAFMQILLGFVSLFLAYSLFLLHIGRGVSKSKNMGLSYLDILS